MRLLVSALSALAAAGMAAAAAGLLAKRPPRSRQSSPNQWFAQAGISVTRSQFVVSSFVAGLLAVLTVAAITGSWLIGFFPGVLVGLLPRAYFSNVRRRRMAEVRQAWPDGLRDLVASLSAGRSLNRALVDLANHGPEPLREAFDRFEFLSRSVGVRQALDSVREDLADPTTDRVVEVLIVAHERGGAIVPEILRDLAEATARDTWAHDEIETAALEQKINARAVFILPWVVLIAMTARPGMFRDFYQTQAGVLVVLIGGVLSLTGAMLVSRLGRQPDEPRVLGGDS